jgi:hypothetical protein
MVFPQQAVLASRANTTLRRALNNEYCEEGEGEVGKLQMAAVNVADKVNELGEFCFHGNTSFFGLDAPHHTPTQDAKQGAKMTNFGQPVSSR